MLGRYCIINQRQKTIISGSNYQCFLFSSLQLYREYHILATWDRLKAAVLDRTEMIRRKQLLVCCTSWLNRIVFQELIHMNMWEDRQARCSLKSIDQCCHSLVKIFAEQTWCHYWMIKHMSHLFHQSWSQWHSTLSLSLSLSLRRCSFVNQSSLCIWIKRCLEKSFGCWDCSIAQRWTFPFLSAWWVDVIRVVLNVGASDVMWSHIVIFSVIVDVRACPSRAGEKENLIRGFSSHSQSNYSDAHRSFIVHLTCWLIFYWSSVSISARMTGINRIFFDLFVFVDKWTR